MRTMYIASATTSGARDGHVRASDGVLDLELSSPKEMGGKGGSGTNPEQLFAAGSSACLEGALRWVASQHNKNVGEVSITANVDIGKVEDGGFGLAVELIGHLPDLPQEEAESS